METEEFPYFPWCSPDKPHDLIMEEEETYDWSDISILTLMTLMTFKFIQFMVSWIQ